jgi:cellulose biosynthesis protein BcsQ
MPKVIVIAQRKGGCSKTTLAVSLAAVAACDNVSAQKRSRGREAFPRGNGPILLDLDSQANATTWAIGKPARDTFARAQTVAMLAFPVPQDNLFHGSPLRGIATREELLEAVLPSICFDSVVPGLRVIGSTPSVHPEDTRELVVSRLPADIVIVDTGADTSTRIVRSVLAQADVVIIPTVPEPWSLDGIGEVLAELRSVGRLDLLDTNRVRVVITRREKNKTHDAVEQSIRDRIPQWVSPTVVPKSAAIGLVSHDARLLTPTHVLRKISGAILRETLDAAMRAAA